MCIRDSLNEGNRKFRLHQAGLEIEGEAESNLVVKAYKLLDDQFNLPQMCIRDRYIIACDSYAGAPAMQVADECEVFSMLDGCLLYTSRCV